MVKLGEGKHILYMSPTLYLTISPTEIERSINVDRIIRMAK